MKLKGYIKNGDKMQEVCTSDTIAVGCIIPFAGNVYIPVGFLLCNGASVSRATYPDLFDVIGTTYGSVDDEHFNLPDLTDKFIEGASNAGTNKEAGLPNIDGGYNSMDTRIWGTSDLDLTDGALRCVPVGDYSVTLGGSGFFKRLVFDASNSNSIYGNSNTVQPPALTMRYIIKAFGGASADSTDVAITNVANDVTNLASTSEIVASGSNYVRYANGVQICWGTSDEYDVAGNNFKLFALTYPQAFKDINYSINVSVLWANGNGWQNCSHITAQKTNSTINAYIATFRSATEGLKAKISYIAVGLWK